MLGSLHEFLEGIDRFFVCLLGFFLAFGIGRTKPTEPAGTLRQRRHGHMQGAFLNEEHVVRCPPVEMDNRALAGNSPPGWLGQGSRCSPGPRDANMLTVGMHSTSGAKMRSERGDVGGVAGLDERADLGQSQGAARVDHARINMQTPGVYNARTGGNRDVGPHRMNLILHNHDRAVLESRSADRMNRCTGNGVSPVKRIGNGTIMFPG